MKRVFLLFFCPLTLISLYGEEFSSPHMLKDGLDRFWAQQYTGVDLLRKELETSSDWKISRHLVQIWDTHVQSHGEQVAQLMGGPYSSGLIPLEKPFAYTELFSIMTEDIEHYGFLNCKANNSCPSYINISMSFPRYPRYLKRFSDMIATIDEQDISSMFSAGNTGLIMDAMRSAWIGSEDFIVVGNCDTDGNPHKTSSYSSQITVCAPSSELLQSYDFMGNPKTFGGTSGATPMVTSALATFTAITGYSLNPREAVGVLKKTALPHPDLPAFSNMGAGMLNAWKIGNIAFRLKKLCGKEDEACYASNLSLEETFRFSIDKKSLFEKAAAVFPYCMGDKREGGTSLEKKLLLDELRKAALLDTTDGRLWKLIACINEKRLLWRQVEYYNGLASRVAKKDKDLIEELLEERRYLFVAKYIPFSSEMASIFMERLHVFREIDRVNILKAVSENIVANAENIPGHKKFLEKLVNDTKIYPRTLISIGKRISCNTINIPAYKDLLEIIINHDKIDAFGLQEIGQEIIFNGADIPDHEQLLEMIINHEKIDTDALGWVGVSIAYDAESIPSHEKLLETIVNHKDIDGDFLGRIVVETIINEKNIPSYEKIFETIINHGKMTAFSVESLARKIIANSKIIPHYKIFLESVMAHRRIDAHALKLIGKDIIFNAQNIPHHEELLISIINDEKISAVALQNFGVEITFNVHNIPGHNKLLKMIMTKLDNKI